MTMRTTRTIALASAALLVAACSGGSTSETTTTAAAETTMSMDMGSHEDFAFGSPAEATDAARTIEVEAGDTLTFTPENVSVSRGEVVTFHVTNSGQLPHEFVLGDEDSQTEHEEEMSSMGAGMEMEDEANAIALAPGESKDITWEFNEAGTVLFGCHQPGHYAAGMLGTITVGA